jgi:hypothetical protein
MNPILASLIAQLVPIALQILQGIEQHILTNGPILATPTAPPAPVTTGS